MKFKRIARVEGTDPADTLTDTQRCQRALEGLASRVGLKLTDDAEDLLALVAATMTRLDTIAESQRLLANARSQIESLSRELEAKDAELKRVHASGYVGGIERSTETFWRNKPAKPTFDPTSLDAYRQDVYRQTLATKRFA